MTKMWNKLGIKLQILNIHTYEEYTILFFLKAKKKCNRDRSISKK
jgi:hypothetical protein